MNKISKILILGGGQAAAYAAKEIRSIDIKSDLTIISEEKYLPYERPPLSKDYILDKVTFDDLFFFPENFYKECTLSSEQIHKIIYNSIINQLEDNSDILEDVHVSK